VETSVKARLDADREFLDQMKKGKNVNSSERDDLWKKHFQNSRFFTSYRNHQLERQNIKK
jgi:hypothetical protein